MESWIKKSLLIEFFSIFKILTVTGTFLFSLSNIIKSSFLLLYFLIISLTFDTLMSFPAISTLPNWRILSIDFNPALSAGLSLITLVTISVSFTNKLSIPNPVKCPSSLSATAVYFFELMYLEKGSSLLTTFCIASSAMLPVLVLYKYLLPINPITSSILFKERLF